MNKFHTGESPRAANLHYCQLYDSYSTRIISHRWRITLQ